MKKVVKFRKVDDTIIEVGHRALIHPIDHSSTLVSNTMEAITSPVIRVFTEIKGFETMNTIYVEEMQ